MVELEALMMQLNEKGLIMMNEKRLELETLLKESDKDYFLLINGDSHRYFQILLNFMSNAVKFTPMDGNIKI